MPSLRPNIQTNRGTFDKNKLRKEARGKITHQYLPSMWKGFGDWGKDENARETNSQPGQRQAVSFLWLQHLQWWEPAIAHKDTAREMLRCRKNIERRICFASVICQAKNGMLRMTFYSNAPAPSSSLLFKYIPLSYTHLFPSFFWYSTYFNQTTF